MTEFAKATIEEFTRALASGEPTPGGGSASALAAVHAASLMSMFCNLTIGRKKYASVEPKMNDALTELARAQERCTELVGLDSEAYKSVMAAFRMSKETEEQKSARSKAIQEGTIRAAKVPLEVCTWAVRVLEVGQKIYKDGNTNALTDAGVAVQLAMAAFAGAALNVYVNLGSIKDDTFVVSSQKTVHDLENRARLISIEMAGYIFGQLGVAG